MLPAVIRAGAGAVQVRVKSLATSDWIRYVRAAGEIVRANDALFLVNDRVDIALVVRADGVHLGVNDLPVREARALLGPGAVIGASARTPEAAVQAERDGADYIGIGPLFASPTKPDLTPLPNGRIDAVRNATRLPLVGIGGIDRDRARKAGALGIDGIAVISALWKSASPAEEAREMVNRFREGRRIEPQRE